MLTRIRAIAQQIALLTLPCLAWADSAPHPGLPADAPLPPAAVGLNVASTPNTVMFEFIFRASLPELKDQVERALADHGWTSKHCDMVEGSFFFGEAEKAARSLTYHAHSLVDPGQPNVSMQITDTAVESCRPEPLPRSAAAEGQAILDAMESAYRNAKAYSDAGRQRTVVLKDGKESYTTTLAYRTAFRRPGMFRFEFVDEDDRYIVHQSGDTIQNYWTLDAVVERFDSLDEAMAGPTGVSSGTVNIAASLLGIASPGWITDNIRDLELGPEEPIGGVTCIVVQGFDRACQPLRLWIGKEDRLLRQIEEYETFPNFHARSTTTIEPTLNAAVPDADLAFNQEDQLPLEKTPGATGFLQRIVEKFF